MEAIGYRHSQETTPLCNTSLNSKHIQDYALLLISVNYYNCAFDHSCLYINMVCPYGAHIMIIALRLYVFILQNQH